MPFFACPHLSHRVITGFAIGALTMITGTVLFAADTTGADLHKRGLYFTTKPGDVKPLPTFAAMRQQLPQPIFAEHPEYVDAYWKAWEIGSRHFYAPTSANGFVSPYIDAAFSQCIYMWDTCFMTMFCNYGSAYVPGICSLDNFYAKQFANGEICREIFRTDGRDYWLDAQRSGLRSAWGLITEGDGRRPFTVTYVGREAPMPPPHLTLDGLNHPIMAWAELESFRITADRERLGRIYEPLLRYYRALQVYLRQGNGLYMTDWASMDNSPRNEFLVGGGTAIDTSAEMVLFARQLAQIATLLDKPEAAAGLLGEASELSALINKLMWDPQRKFYLDLTVDGKFVPNKTVAAFWTLIAGVAGPEQITALVAELRNPASFGRIHRVPTLSAEDAAFRPDGGYWCGSSWAPTTTMVIRGLEQVGHRELADEIALEHLRAVTTVFQETGTFWENYAPDRIKAGNQAKEDFVGWSGVGPIMYLIEYGLGLRADAVARTLTWTIRSDQRIGIERFRFGDITVSLVCSGIEADGRRTMQVRSSAPFLLKVEHHGKLSDYQISADQEMTIPLTR